MKYDWCVCDMDGTLLNSKDIITKENIEALKKLQQGGTEIILASGRVDLTMKCFVQQLGLKGYIISCNGALIRNIENSEAFYTKEISTEDVLGIIAYCMNHSMDFLFYTSNTVYSNKNNPRAEKYENQNKAVKKDLQIPLKYVDDAMMNTIQDLEVLKILLICDNHQQVVLLQDQFTERESLTVVSSAEGVLDIMASQTSKGRALKILANKLNINLDRVIAFGDNYNDIEMLQCVGMPIAMENAVEKLKAEAKYITLSNDASGVAYAINQFISHLQ